MSSVIYLKSVLQDSRLSEGRHQNDGGGVQNSKKVVVDTKEWHQNVDALQLAAQLKSSSYHRKFEKNEAGLLDLKFLIDIEISNLMTGRNLIWCPQSN